MQDAPRDKDDSQLYLINSLKKVDEVIRVHEKSCFAISDFSDELPQIRQLDFLNVTRGLGYHNYQHNWIRWPRRCLTRDCKGRCLGTHFFFFNLRWRLHEQVMR